MQLDGKPMKIEVMGINIGAPAMPPFANASFSNGVPRRYTGYFEFPFLVLIHSFHMISTKFALIGLVS